MGVVTCGTRGCARGPPSSAPTICSEAKSRWGKGRAQGEEGAAEGSTGPTSALTSPPTPTFLKQMSPIDELKVRSSLPPPTRPPTAEGGRKRGQGEWGGNQARPTLRPAGSLSYPSKAAAWGPPPGNQAPGQRGPSQTAFPPTPAPGPADGEVGAHRPSGFGSHPAGHGWGLSWLLGTPREVRSFHLRGAEVHALTLWAQSFISCPHGREVPSNKDPDWGPVALHWRQRIAPGTEEANRHPSCLLRWHDSTASWSCKYEEQGRPTKLH